MVVLKRKRDFGEQGEQSAPVITRPKAGTKSFASGKAVKDALDTASPQAFVSFRQQIVTPHSSLPLALNHPAVVIIQHYLDISPTCEEIFRAWQIGDQTKTEVQAQAAVELLAEIINILTPIPFFRSSVIGIVNKLVSTNEPCSEYLNRLCQSGRRDDVYHGYLLSAAAIAVDPPTSTSLGSTSSGRLGLKVWAVLVEGGSVRGLGKQLGMRRRNKEGMVGYGETDPLDKPDIRHLILRTVLPLLSSSTFQAHARSILPPLYSGLAADPPITVYRVLTALWNAVSGPSIGLNRRTSLVLFHEKSLEHLWQLLSRQDVEASTGKTVSEIAEAFLEEITTVPGQGICFTDEGWYSRRVADVNPGTTEGNNGISAIGPVGDDRNDNWKKGLHNRILGNVVRKVGNKAVDDDGVVGNWLVKVFEACPELIAGYWAHSALAVDPRLNARWVATMAYIGRIISLPPPSLNTFRQNVPADSDPSSAPFRSQPPATSVIIESILPAPLTKTHIMKGLQHTDGLVQHVTAITLARGLQKLSDVQQLFLQIEQEIEDEPSTSQENAWTKGRRELELEARKRIPELSVIIAFAQKAATMAPSEAETEAEIALASKSAMLTEIALRIFGLCNKTMPSMGSEMKFDVGRLLVSASSASAERRARREAREGSVVSFEALSQLHVLQLLGEVRDWTWMNKAAGSQYTYLYHILLLNLSTRQPVTQLKTVALLEHLLLPTLLFDHDASELSIWLEGLPRASDKISGPMLLAQQIHLLSFLDDCFRRATKTPYRYIEDSFALVPDYFEYSRLAEMISPVLMTILEQLNAKIMGQLISTEAAGVVLVYIRRIILGLVGKQKNLRFLFAIIDKLDEMLDKAQESGQARVGLKDVVQGMRDDLALVQGGKASKKAKVDDPEAHRLRDEEDWSSRSFEQTCLTTAPDDWAETAYINRLDSIFVQTADDATTNRRANFLLQLLPSKKGFLATTASKSSALQLLDRCLASLFVQRHKAQLKSNVFENDYLKKLFLSDKGDQVRSSLIALVAHLSPAIPADASIGETSVLELLDALKHDKKGEKTEQILLLLQPWIRFLREETAMKALKAIVKRADTVIPFLNPKITVTIESIVITTRDPVYSINHIKDLVRLKSISPVVQLIRDTLMDRENRKSLTDLSIKKGTIRELLATREDAAFELITVLAQTTKEAAETIQQVLVKDVTLLEDERILPSVEILLDLPSDVSKTKLDVVPLAVKILVSSNSSTHQYSASRLLTRLSQQKDSNVMQEISKLKLADYDLPLARLTEKMAEKDDEVEPSTIKHLVELGLQYAVRVCSKASEISLEDQTTLISLDHAITTATSTQVDVQLAEPVITAIIQDRLHVEEAVKLAVTLARRVEMKASFIRQQLQALLASSAYNRCIDSTCPASTRLNFIRLLHSLFSASTYVSCQPNFIEPLVPLYRGSLSESDRLILNMFQLFEGYRKLSISSILRYWSASGIIGSGNRSFDALTSLDAQKVFATCQAYPLRRPLRGYGKSDQNPENGEALYDPVFVMNLLASTMSEGTVTGLDWVEILRSNALGLTICGLSSRDKDLRAVAGYTLAKAYSLINKKPFYERNQLLYTLRILRHSIETPSTRVPTLTSLFFAHALRSLANPSHFLYPLSSRFLLQRHVFDPTDTPMLYSMLYASGDGWKRERGWMIRFLKDGVRSEADWRVIRRRKVWSLLATLFSSSLDPSFRRSVLQAMESMVSIPAAARSLVLRDGLIVWLSNQWTNVTRRQASSNLKGTKAQTWEKDEKATILKLVEKVCIGMIPTEIERIKEGKDVGNWIGHVEIFYRRILDSDVDVERLEILSRILYRLSTIPQINIISTTLPSLVDQLKKLDESPANPRENVLSYLFHVGLNVSVADKKYKTGVRDAIEDIGWRVERGDAGVELAEWVRKERRLVEWEK
uniref:Nucleolar pre-ribosomal-associated protein 1 n=1 Tax=Kwoniella bestiolae CBS 10118 TaxID=1296100 RepID=A0A1B9GA43_9TREE|nr:hypothetical protein I302_02734 [Kwoniella bestiolae CBS 10118]OCF27884.1 hypothetical protein I302_02734 [Kwoniella bestiolae CBS 10118]